MPHLVIEYAKDLEQRASAEQMVAAAFAAAKASGLFQEADIKVRAEAFAAYSTGGTDQPFAHVDVKLLPGRTDHQRKALAEGVLAALTALLPDTTAISVETSELHRASYSKRT